MSLALALEYASTGWPVFPCKPSDKAPLSDNGFKDATTDERRIRSWWLRHPKAMVGVPAGEASGVWVLDVDNRPEEGKDGHAALAALEAEHGPLPETITVRTGSGGSHRLFKYGGVEIRNRAGFAPGLDTRGKGGYFIAAGSERSDGSTYEWEARPDEPAEAPEWLVEIVRKRRPAERSEASSDGPAFTRPTLRPRSTANCGS
jgi:hypothetical protein